MFGGLHFSTGAAYDSPDSAPPKISLRAAAKGTRKSVQFKYRKGSASFDFVFAALLFIIILGFTAVTYSGYVEQYVLNEKKAELETKVLAISDTLVKSKGYPIDWEDDVSGLEVLGLAESENILSMEKMNALNSISYNESAELLGINGEYYIEIRSIDDQIFFSKGVELTNSSSVSIERTVYFNQTFCKLVVRLYE
jgi:hypothetical protein